MAHKQATISTVNKEVITHFEVHKSEITIKVPYNFIRGILHINTSEGCNFINLTKTRGFSYMREWSDTNQPCQSILLEARRLLQTDTNSGTIFKRKMEKLLRRYRVPFKSPVKSLSIERERTDDRKRGMSKTLSNKRDTLIRPRSYHQDYPRARSLSNKRRRYSTPPQTPEKTQHQRRSKTPNRRSHRWSTHDNRDNQHTYCPPAQHLRQMEEGRNNKIYDDPQLAFKRKQHTQPQWHDRVHKSRSRSNSPIHRSRSPIIRRNTPPRSPSPDTYLEPIPIPTKPPTPPPRQIPVRVTNRIETMTTTPNTPITNPNWNPWQTTINKKTNRPTSLQLKVPQREDNNCPTQTDKWKCVSPRTATAFYRISTPATSTNHQTDPTAQLAQYTTHQLNQKNQPNTPTKKTSHQKTCNQKHTSLASLKKSAQKQKGMKTITSIVTYQMKK